MQAETATNPTAVPPLEDWLSVEEFAEKHAKLCTINLLRWQLRRRDENGLASAVTRSGHKLLISQQRYAAWLAARGDRPVSR